MSFLLPNFSGENEWLIEEFIKQFEERSGQILWRFQVQGPSRVILKSEIALEKDIRFVMDRMNPVNSNPTRLFVKHKVLEYWTSYASFWLPNDVHYFLTYEVFAFPGARAAEAIEPFFEKYCKYRLHLIKKLKSTEGLGYSGGFTGEDLVTWLLDKDFCTNEETAIITGNFLMADWVIVPAAQNKKRYFWRDTSLYKFFSPPQSLYELLTDRKEFILESIQKYVPKTLVWVKPKGVWLKEAFASNDLIQWVLNSNYCSRKPDAVIFINLLLRSSQLRELTDGAFFNSPNCFVYFAEDHQEGLSEVVMKYIFAPAESVQTPSTESVGKLWETIKMKQATLRNSTIDRQTFRKSAMELNLPIAAPPPSGLLLPPPTIEYKYELDISFSGIKIIKRRVETAHTINEKKQDIQKQIVEMKKREELHFEEAHSSSPLSGKREIRISYPTLPRMNCTFGVTDLVTRMIHRSLCRLEIQGPRSFMKNNYFQSNRFLSWAATQPTLKAYSGFGEKLLEALVNKGTIEPVAATHVSGLYYSFTTNWEEHNLPWVKKYHSIRTNLTVRLKGPKGVRDTKLKRMLEAQTFDSEKLVEWLLRNKEAHTPEEALIFSNFLIADQIITPAENFSDLLVSGDSYQFEQPSSVLEALKTNPNELRRDLPAKLNTLQKYYITTFDEQVYRNVFKASDFIDAILRLGIVESTWDGVLYGQALVKLGVLEEITCGFDDFDDCFTKFVNNEPDPVIKSILLAMSKKITISFIGEIREPVIPKETFDSRRSLSSRQLLNLSKARISLATKTLESLSNSPVPERRRKGSRAVDPTHGDRANAPVPSTGFGNSSVLSKPSTTLTNSPSQSRMSVALGDILQQLDDPHSSMNDLTDVETSDVEPSKQSTEEIEAHSPPAHSPPEHSPNSSRSSPRSRKARQSGESPNPRRKGIRVTEDFDIITNDPNSSPFPSARTSGFEVEEMMSVNSNDSLPTLNRSKGLIPARNRSITHTGSSKKEEKSDSPRGGGTTEPKSRAKAATNPYRASLKFKELFTDPESELQSPSGPATPNMSIHQHDSPIVEKRD